VLDEPYIQLRPVWGQRIDIRTSTRLDFTIHHQLSISPSGEDGVMALGATHDLNYNPQLCSEPYDLEPGRKELIGKALDTIELKDIEVIGDYTGLRSGSNDYLPLLGRVVKAEISSVEEPEYYPALYMINGVGGYGFVQGPYLARQLSRHILYGEELDEKLAPERFFRRWIKRGRGMAK
jgi:tRNA 5-methylaminomethyl-2-thiouridine biosynthesis bifunctional protein